MSKSNYPFTENSTMLLDAGLRIGPGVVISANIYPDCGKVQYAQITFIGRKHSSENIGHIFISDESSNLICDVQFNLTNTTYPITGVAYRSGKVCGVMVVTRELMPILHSGYYPASGSFIFTPSVFTPRPLAYITGTTGNLIASTGEVIPEVKFDSEQFQLVDGVVMVVDKPDTEVELRVPVQSISINGVEVTTTSKPADIIIRSTPGSGILFDSETSEILVGGYRDL